MALVEPIKISGLAEFNRNLRKLDSNLPKALRVALNDASGLVVDWARPKVPTRSGRARASVKAKSTRTQARVSGGSARVPYYPWLDFGGKVGPSGSVKRTYYGGGRYIYPGLDAKREDVDRALVAALLDVVRQAGIDVE